MRLLVLNWRDIHHPRAGGAEVLTHGFARLLARRGHTVDWFSGMFEKALSQEIIDGITVYRGGNAVTVRTSAYHFYRSARPQYDIVIDEINTLPFFTPFFARRPVAFICQLAREVWFYETRQPVSAIGYRIEPLYLRPYRYTPTLSISPSSAQSLRDIGLRGTIGVMPIALDQYDAGEPLTLSERGDTLVALCRITPSKRIDAMIAALAALPAHLAHLRLQVIGNGPERERVRLRECAKRYGVENRIEWLGYQDELEKRRILRQAKAILMTSVREGWGLVVSEANLAGTPAVAYDVGGLRDSVLNGKTGYLSPASPCALADQITRLLVDEGNYLVTARRAQELARSLTWEKTTNFVENFLVELNRGA